MTSIKVRFALGSDGEAKTSRQTLDSEPPEEKAYRHISGEIIPVGIKTQIKTICNYIYAIASFIERPYN